MTDYAPTFTSRIYVQYSSLGKIHTLSLRYEDADDPPRSDIQDGLIAFLNSTAPWRFEDWTVLETSYSLAGSSVRIPFILPDPITEGEATLLPTSYRPVYASFVGKSSAGARTGCYLYGIGLDPAKPTEDALMDYRLTGAEDATTATIIATLSACPGLVSIDGLDVNWRNYVNLGFNAYYQRKARGA